MGKFYFVDLLSQLPPFIARKDVGRLLGGIITTGTLANADCKGEGPAKKRKVGRRIFYETQSLLEWLESRK